MSTRRLGTRRGGPGALACLAAALALCLGLTGCLDREYALVAGEGTLEKRYITTGVELGDGVEVASGLEEGELVAVPRDGSAGEPGRYLLEGG